jgi:hypothetical protein
MKIFINRTKESMALKDLLACIKLEAVSDAPNVSSSGAPKARKNKKQRLVQHRCSWTSSYLKRIHGGYSGSCTGQPFPATLEQPQRQNTIAKELKDFG